MIAHFSQHFGPPYKSHKALFCYQVALKFVHCPILNFVYSSIKKINFVNTVNGWTDKIVFLCSLKNTVKKISVFILVYLNIKITDVDLKPPNVRDFVWILLFKRLGLVCLDIFIIRLQLQNLDKLCTRIGHQILLTVH